MRKFTYLQIISAFTIFVFFSAQVFAGNLTFTAPPSSGEYTTMDGLITAQTDCRIEPGNNVTFNGALGVTLKPGFHAKAGSNFTAKMPDWDGLPNQWELDNFGNLNSSPGDDPDFDGLTNEWELANFGNLSQSAGDDPDHDGLTNAEEFLLGTNPNQADPLNPSPLQAQLQIVTNNGAKPVGSIAGKFSVSSLGAAVYNVPIDVPPGVGGVEPKLSLVYNSGAGNGIMGVGWGLAGLSAICRVPATIAQDGYKGGVNYDNSDRFALDGERLIIVSGYYGADGSEYRTEKESFSKIIAYGTSGNGPAYFKIWTKSGHILTLGTDDARIKAEGKETVQVWGLKTVEDRNHNYLSVSYQNNHDGEFRVLRIDYTGNSATSLPCARSVQFEYISRPDITPKYDAGSLLKTTGLLSHVKTYADNTLVSDYQLTYEPSPSGSTGRSRLLCLMKSDSDGNSLPSTSFLWQDSVSTFSTVDQSWGRNDFDLEWSTHKIITGDFNGDGRTDLLVLDNNNGYEGFPFPHQTEGKNALFLADQNGHLQLAQTWSSSYLGLTWNQYTDSPPYTRVITGDFNGDGRTDLFMQCGTAWTTTNAILLADEDGRFTSVHQSWPTRYLNNSWDFNASNIFTGDFNGDGRTDLFLFSRISSNTNTILLADPDGSFTQVKQTWANDYLGLNWNCTPTNLVLGDFNGDGRTDFLLQSHQSSNRNDIIFADPDGSFTTPVRTWPNDYMGINWNTTPSILIPGDFNGDGKTDILIQSKESSNDNALMISKGNGDFIKQQAWNNDYLGINWNAFPSLIMPADFNGDGRTDLLILSKQNSNTNAIVLADFDGRFTSVHNTWPNNYLGQYWNSLDSIPAPGDFNGDGRTDVFLQAGGNLNVLNNILALSSTNQPAPYSDLITGITTGFTANTVITYKPLTDDSVYTKGTDTVYPTTDIQGPTYVVSSFDSSDGVGGQYGVSYSYGQARVDNWGRGFLGFGWVEELDEETGLTTTTYYSQDAPRYAGMIQRVDKELANGTLIYSLENTLTSKAYGGGSYFFSYPDTTTESKFDLTGQLLSSTTTTNQYDDYGNPTRITFQSNDGYSKTVNNTYDNTNTANWLIGRLTREEITSTTPSHGSKTRVSTFTHDPTTGLLTRLEVEPGTSIRLLTEYGYDNYGNINLTTVSGNDIQTRSTSSYHDPQGHYETTTNPMGHVERRDYDIRFGVPTSLTDANSINTTWNYDGFGRKIGEYRADGSQTNWTYSWCFTGRPALACYSIRMQTTKNGIACGVHDTKFFDILDRDIRSANGRGVYKDTEYDHLSRLKRTSRPYFLNETPLWTTYDNYDELRRVRQITDPVFGVSTYSYNGLTTTKTNSLLQTRVEVRDSQDQVTQITEAPNCTTYYEYEPFGNLSIVRNALGNVTSTTYDNRGRKISMNDPDMGLWNYQYDAAGNLRSQTDAKGQTITFSYDTLNRITNKHYPTGTDVNYFYDEPTSAYSIGRLTTITDASGSEQYFYDQLGRAIKTTKTVDGTSYSIETVYNSLGQITSLKYPDGETVNYNYDSVGNLAQVPGYATFTNYTALNQAKNVNCANTVNTVRQYYSDGRMYSITTNGPSGALQNIDLQYDSGGNITRIRDYIDGNRTQNFTYDNLNRLTQASSQVYGTINYGYDAIGNMTYNSQVGTYTYDYNYQPHAVKQAGPNTYVYDANGNMTGRAGNQITYDYENRPVTMQSSSGIVTCVYDHAGNRVKKITASGTTIYIGKLCEYKSGICTKHIFAGQDRIATKVSGTVEFYHSDHLGSTGVVTDASGNKIGETYYYPFGATRTGSVPVKHKFTGQEEDGETGLYYYGARYYDPQIGRFICADTIVPNPLLPQTFNRYSYCFNNPVVHTDPNGHMPPLWFMAALVFFADVGMNMILNNNVNANNGQMFLRAAVSAALAYCAFYYAGYYIGTHSVDPVAKFAIHAAAGATSAGVSSAIFGGNIGLSMAIAAVSAGIAEGIGNSAFVNAQDLGYQFAIHAIVGGVSGGITAELYGGKFGDGFTRGAITAAAAFVFNKLGDHPKSKTDKTLEWAKSGGIKWRLESIKFSFGLKLIFGGSASKVTFVSDCNIETDLCVVKEYIVIGGGIGVGARIGWNGPTKGIGGGITCLGEPDPAVIFSTSGPSGGIGHGLTLGSASTDFNSFGQAYAMEAGNIIGGSLFETDISVCFKWAKYVRPCR